MDCINYTVIPTLPNDECQGDRIKTGCVYSPNAYSLLGLSANSTQEQINNALVLVFNNLNTTITAQALLIADLEARIVALEP